MCCGFAGERLPIALNTLPCVAVRSSSLRLSKRYSTKPSLPSGITSTINTTIHPLPTPRGNPAPKRPVKLSPTHIPVPNPTFNSSMDTPFHAVSSKTSFTTGVASPNLNVEPRLSSRTYLERYVSNTLVSGNPAQHAVSVNGKILSSKPIFAQTSTTSPLPTSNVRQSSAIFHEHKISVTTDVRAPVGKAALFSDKLLSSQPAFLQAQISSQSPTFSSNPRFSSATSHERSAVRAAVLDAPVQETAFLNGKMLSSKPIFSQTHTQAAPASPSSSPHSIPPPSSGMPLQPDAKGQPTDGTPVQKIISLHVHNLSSEPIFSQTHSTTQGSAGKSKQNVTEADTDNSTKVYSITTKSAQCHLHVFLCRWFLQKVLEHYVLLVKVSCS